MADQKIKYTKLKFNKDWTILAKDVASSHRDNRIVQASMYISIFD